MFFKSDEMNLLDEEIGDLDAFIKDTESLIVSDLEEEILECESELRTTFSMLADLDCILSLAGCALDLNFVRPDICPAEAGIISIENGRHPLQELIVDDEFIPNDTLMDNNNRVMIVTGPNFSGKSCYARQVGILVYLAHIGSFLPCDSAKISIMDQIIVNFGDVETCSIPQSTFQRDLTQMAGIMRKSTPTSLVLIDEFGKGNVSGHLQPRDFVQNDMLIVYKSTPNICRHCTNIRNCCNDFRYSASCPNQMQSCLHYSLPRDVLARLTTRIQWRDQGRSDENPRP